MSKARELHFSFQSSTLVLRQFLLRKKTTINEEIKEKKFSEEGLQKVYKYLQIVDAILKSEYFVGKNLNVRVGDLMTRLKREDVDFNIEIKDLQKQKEEKEYQRNVCEGKKTEGGGYAIPSESQEYFESLERRSRELVFDIERIQSDIKGYEYRLWLCRNLKGIIMRPEGFFSSIYKI